MTICKSCHGTGRIGRAECAECDGGGLTYICHYVENYWNGSKPLCGAEFVDAETTAKEAVTCPVCLELLKQEQAEQSETPQMDEWRKQIVKELLGGADSV